MPPAEDRPLVSTVLICAPPDVAEFTETFRSRYAGVDYHHVPPHITVMWPFVSPGTVQQGADPAILEEATQKLRAVCQNVEPFLVTLDRYGTFAGRVLYLAPQDPTPIVALHEEILRAFPGYLPYGGQFGMALVPHLTLGFFDSEEELNAVPRPPFEPFTFRVGDVYFMYGDIEVPEPWKTVAIIPLGRRRNGPPLSESDIRNAPFDLPGDAR